MKIEGNGIKLFRHLLPQISEKISKIKTSSGTIIKQLNRQIETLT